ncbi:MAG: tyrosine-type recombinase/integrase, partial [Nitrososphaeraceae archaeon]
YAYIHGRLASIFHFYTINRVTLNKLYVSKFQQEKKKVKKDTAYSREQIGQMLSTCNVRQKVIVLLLASTGMRVGALHSLSLSNLKRININGNQYLYKIIVYEMEKEEYYTFTTFECAKAIDEYLEYRKRFGEILKPEAPLIREEFDRNDLGEARKPRSIKARSFVEFVNRILLQAGIKESTHKKEGQQFKTLLQPVKRCHGFRKFTITQMIKAKLDYEAREYLVGHRYSRGLDENYDRTSEEDRLKEFLKAVNNLTINEENRLRLQVAEQQSTLTQVQELAEQIELIKNVIQGDQAQVRKIRSSPDFKKKLLQKG